MTPMQQEDLVLGQQMATAIVVGLAWWSWSQRKGDDVIDQLIAEKGVRREVNEPCISDLASGCRRRFVGFVMAYQRRGQERHIARLTKSMNASVRPRRPRGATSIDTGRVQ